jgi:hypothetical protein
MYPLDFDEFMEVCRTIGAAPCLVVAYEQKASDGLKTPVSLVQAQVAQSESEPPDSVHVSAHPDARVIVFPGECRRSRSCLHP